MMPLHLYYHSFRCSLTNSISAVRGGFSPHESEWVRDVTGRECIKMRALADKHFYDSAGKSWNFSEVKIMKRGNWILVQLHIHFQVVWILSQAAADTAASALTSAAASVRKAGRVRTAPSPTARMTARARGRAWKGSACATVTSEGRTARSRGAPPTARAGGCASMASACARSPSPGRTAWSGGAWTTAQTRAPASTGRASAGPAMSGRTARWFTVPTTAARRGSARMASVSARMALPETTATQVGVFFMLSVSLIHLAVSKDKTETVWHEWFIPRSRRRGHVTLI